MHMYPKAHLIPGEVMSILGFWDFFLFCKDTGKRKKEFPAVEDQLLLDCLYWLLSSVVRANTNLYCISQKTEAF